jgi:NAD(P)-dependent dehydrogenase (short-subunit alcohol dehydrogenase family)
MDLGLSGRACAVTGASRGIGRETARKLCAEDAGVLLVARSEEQLAEAAEECGREGGRAAALTLDVTAEDAGERIVAEATELFGQLDVLVNNAGTARRRDLDDVPDEDWYAAFELNVMAPLRTMRAAVPPMAERGWGRIVNVSGLAARQTGSVVGSVRNVAVAAMTKNLADEYGAQGVNVTVVHPAMTRTERTPDTLAAMAAARGCTPAEVEAAIADRTTIGRMVTAQEVASVIVFLASPRSVSITGDPIAVGGGARGTIHY